MKTNLTEAKQNEGPENEDNAIVVSFFLKKRKRD